MYSQGMVSEGPHGVCGNVLHTLRCVGVVGAARLATASGVATGDTQECLNQLADMGLAVLAPGPFGGWGITDAGRSADDDWLAGQLEVLETRERIERYYGQFLGLNPNLLQVCSDWQMRTIGNSPALNDHSDADYDAKVLTRLMRIDDSAQTLCGYLADTLDRFSLYQERMSSALSRALAGDPSYVADGLESYHTVWFQLHEDLLTTLGISRDEERRAAGESS